MSKYEDRCLALSIEMARLLNPGLKFTHSHSGIPYSSKQMRYRLMKAATRLLPLARLSVAQAAEQWDEGFAVGCDAGQVCAEPDVGNIKEELGLIPPPNETT